MLAEDKSYDMWGAPMLTFDLKKVVADVFLSENEPVCTLGTIALERPSCFVNLHKWFLGQLPPKASREHIAWFFVEYLKIPILWVEKIKQWSKGGKPTGCFHVYCDPDHEEEMSKQVQKWYCTPDLQVFNTRPQHIPAGWSKYFVTVEKAASVARHKLQGANGSGENTPALSFDGVTDSNDSVTAVDETVVEHNTALLTLGTSSVEQPAKPTKSKDSIPKPSKPTRNQQRQQQTAPPPFSNPMGVPMYAMPQQFMMPQYSFGANFHEGGMSHMYGQQSPPAGVHWVMVPMMPMPMMFPQTTSMDGTQTGIAGKNA